ncbi:P1 family peptidase [Actinomadura alba]
MAISRRDALFAGAVLTGASLTGPVSAANASATPPATSPGAGGKRMRAREFGVTPGGLPTGKHNAITDVTGVRVGHVTLNRGKNVRTGVTAILPHTGNLFQEKVPGAVFIGNAFGKLAGSTQVQELGTIETPIVLTNTLSVGRAVDAVVGWTLEQPGNEGVRSVNALVGETNDGTLNDIRGRHVSAQDVEKAIENATEGPVTEGAVGAGTGTICFGWKGGVGTASRVLPSGYTVGVLVQTNYGGTLMIEGVPVGEELKPPAAAAAEPDTGSSADGSCMMVIATDAPLGERNLERLAARANFGLARTGSAYSNGSGDFAIAFSAAPGLRVRHGETAARPYTLLPNDAMSPFFQAALEATEEAVYNSLFMATTTTGNGRTIEALPLDGVRALFEKYGRNPAG